MAVVLLLRAVCAQAPARKPRRRLEAEYEADRRTSSRIGRATFFGGIRMDSISHTKVARTLLAYVEETCGVTFDQSAFLYGNLKPEYLTKRHYPSVMYDEVMDKIRAFTEKHSIGPVNGRDVSVDLGEICHYMTDFFSYPHNDDIYNHNLLAHYIYEKRTSLRIGKRIDDEKFERWVSPVIPPFTLDALLRRIADLHGQYKNETERHCIANDVVYICRVCTMVVLAVINITYVCEPASETATATA